MAKEKVKVRRSSADKAINAVIAIVMVAVIALAAFALYGKFRPRDKVKDIAEQMGMSVSDFQKEYGLEDVDPNAKFDDVYNDMTVENALKMNGTTFEDEMAAGGIPEGVTADMKMSEVEKIMAEMAEAAPAEGEEGHVHEEGAAPAEGEKAAETSEKPAE